MTQALGLCLILLLIAQAGFFTFLRFCSENFYVMAVLTFGLVLAALPFSIREAPRPWKLLYLTLVSVCGFYLLVSSPTLPEGYRGQFSSVEWRVLTWGGVVGFLCALAAFRRPAFGAVTFGAMTWMKAAQCKAVLGMEGGIRSDFQPLTEIGLFLLLGFAVIHYYRRYAKQGAAVFGSAFIALVMLAIAAHLANYFYSGVAKMLLGGGAFYWPMHNHTDSIVINSYLVGLMPSKALVEAALPHLQSVLLPLNWGIFLLQVAAIFGMFSLPLAILLTVSYDAMHVGIFLLTGILFWKWIVLNAVIVIALSWLRREEFALKFRVWSAVFLVAAPAFFTTIPIAWYDSPSFNHAYFRAVTKDGRAFDIPANYFGDFSIYIGHPKVRYEGHFRTRFMGLTPKYEVLEGALRCDAPEQAAEPFPESERIRDFVRNYHSDVLRRVDAQGRVEYNLFPFHYWATPVLFREFHALDKREITAYEFVVESRCTSLENGKPTFRTMQKDVLKVEVD